MKAILISIKPQYVAKILNGKKTIEIRKTIPKCELPIDVYIYCTKENDLGRIKDLPKDRYFVDCVETPIDFLKMDSAYNGKGKVVAKFTLNKVEEIDKIYGNYAIKENEKSSIHYECWLHKTCLLINELDTYLNGNIGYAWHIGDLEIFDRPKELSEFYGCCDNYTKNVNIFKNINDRYVAQYFNNPKCLKCKHYDGDNWCSKIEESLTKAPQSWCYVEVI